jgi:hypothetical protein
MMLPKDKDLVFRSSTLCFFLTEIDFPKGFLGFPKQRSVKKNFDICQATLKQFGDLIKNCD